MKKYKIYLSIFCVTACFFVTPVFANVKLAAIFSNGMVLQQQSKVAIWGWADAAEKVTVAGSWSDKTISTVADAAGNWKIMLPTPKAGGPFTLKAVGNNSVEINDVLIGEVWLCSGQSNMGFTLKASDNAKAEIATADLPTIRYFSVKRQYGLQNFKDDPGSVWEKTSPKNAGSYSAVAYFFAKKIQQELGVPVGIIYSAWGGTPAEAWTPSPVLKNDTTLSKYFDRWKAILDNVGKDSVAYHASLTDWEKDSISKKKPEEPQTLYYFNRPWREPSVLFNGMIGPVIPYGIKGVLWYQGESNVGYASEYHQLFSAMINSWRQKWDIPKLPFYFVQIAPFGYSDMNAAAEVREAQYQVSKELPNMGMAVTIDLGNMKNIHFTHKKEVGDRLAFIAMAKNYGVKKMLYKGPECKKATSNDAGNVLLEFDSFGSSLAMKGNELKGFEIGYPEPVSGKIVYVNAAARIENGKVIIWNDKVKDPVVVRYAWLLAGEANLTNAEGLPAFPFKKTI